MFFEGRKFQGKVMVVNQNGISQARKGQVLLSQPSIAKRKSWMHLHI